MDESLLESRLPEDAAHRLLARAVELDATRGAELTITQLRAAAREAGISTAAFEAALREWQSAEVASTEPSRRGVGVPQWFADQATAIGVAVNGAPIRNLFALAAFWGVLVALVSIDRVAGVHWLVRKATDPVALAIGAVIASRLKARPVALLLAGLAVSLGAEFTMDAALGAPAVHGFGSHFALMIAGIAGVLLGGRLHRSPPAERIADAPSTEPIQPAARESRPAEQRQAHSLQVHGAQAVGLS